MSDVPQVSLLMAAYRPRPDWLRTAVEAALSQRGVDIELVVVDDGSPEPVAEQLAWCSDPRLRVVTVDHGGHATTRTRGLSEARGSYVRYLDSDDELPEESTECLIRAAAGRDDMIPYGWTVFCDEELRPRWTMRSQVAGDARVQCVTGGFTVRVPAMLIPRAVARRAVWDPWFRASGDWDYALQLLEYAQVIPVDVEALRYRRHGAGMTSRTEVAQASAARVRERYFERHPEQRGTPVERRAKAFAEAQAARAFTTGGSPARALRHAASAVALSPPVLMREIGRGLAALRGPRRS